MSSESKHIKNIIERHRRIANIQVVFTDIEKYSRRRTSKQIEIIDLFTRLMKESLTETSQKYVSELQDNDINLLKDTILLPTGDGAAVIFSFEDIYDIHLFFAKKLLEKIHLSNEQNKCLIYEKSRWCNCHSNFDVRIGISKEEGLIYQDINGNFNVAGRVINYAARVMSLADSKQIIFTKEAYDKYENLSDDNNLEPKFKRFDNVEIKHNESLTIYQYIGEGESYINQEDPKAIIPPNRSSVSIIKEKENLPIFIATDIEGCVTPENRDEIDLGKFEKLRQYCQFVKLNPKYPQIVFFTGRSQGYVELLAQSLAMINNAPLDLPCVIENGAALYFPKSRRTIPLTSNEQLKIINEARSLLISEFSENRFEPKGYMITVNNQVGQKIETLNREIEDKLRSNGFYEHLETNHSASAVDITAKGINKLFGVMGIVDHYRSETLKEVNLEHIVAVGDHQADLDVLKAVGKGYCPISAPLEVRNTIKEKFGSECVIDAKYTDLILQVIEIECSVKIF